jgi:hypothetical protein
MTAIADIFKSYGAEYLRRYPHNMLPSQQKAMRDIMLCRNVHLGWHEYYCQHCNKVHYLNNSCRNRHCPQCQNDKTQNWINRQQDMLLPVEYFLFTFTIPEDFRDLARSNQKIFYNLLFRVSSECMQRLAHDKRFLGGETGMVGVLHTWTQTLQYHPHIHYVIPAIAYDPDKQILRFARQGFLVHVKALSRMFRFRFRKALQHTAVCDQLPKYIFAKEWIVHGKSVGSGLSAVKYLAQYVYRIAISNQRLISGQNGRIIFRYKDRNSDRDKFMSLDALEFMRRFLQHILPKGFQKVRYYGFLHPKRKNLFDQMRLLLYAKIKTPNQKEINREHVVFCPDCGRPMVCLASKNGGRPPPLILLLELFAV